MSNSVDPDQTAPLILVCTICIRHFIKYFGARNLGHYHNLQFSANIQPENVMSNDFDCQFKEIIFLILVPSSLREFSEDIFTLLSHQNILPLLTGILS